jgi:hypothetical protein
MLPLVRPNYFFGKLLSADDLRLEQNYHILRSRRHNLLLHGTGVVTGLAVSVKNDGDPPAIVVSPGHAIDPLGNEVELCQSGVLALVGDMTACSVVIRQVEQLIDPVPTAGGDSTNDAPAYSKIEEISEIALVPETGATAAASGDLVLARFVKTRTGWRRDPKVKPKRVR